MSDAVRRIADAVLYEGYILWPYRRSALKNRQRWTFGGVFPPRWSRSHPDDRAAVQAQAVLRGAGQDPRALAVQVRFLQIVRRQVVVHGEPVDEAVVRGERHLSWEEAVERAVGAGPFSIAAGSETEELGDGAAIVRSWHGLDGEVRLGAGPPLTLRIANLTEFAGGAREDALTRSLCSCHAVLRTPVGEFASGTEPESAACVNEGLWPVLVEDGGTLLAAPIILEDFPQIAPESPGDLFDGGEIDQLLVLNILSLTDEEKAEMRACDPRAREILERTEALTPDELMALHGRLTDLSRVHG